MVTRILLASNSPRRRELLSLLGLPFESCAPQVDETPRAGETPGAYVTRLAEEKARSAVGQAPLGAVILAADTTVADGSILGKPAHAAKAIEMLTRLRGHTHQVYTAIAVLRPAAPTTLLSELCVTDVPMRAYSDAEIAAYVASGDPLDKAGAYAIQHVGFHPVERLSGCYANVVGLPLCHLTRALRRLGIAPAANTPQACQAALSYDCPVYASILNEAAPPLSK